jgi:quercetin dioxygenase-like cupin family protein
MGPDFSRRRFAAVAVSSALAGVLELSLRRNALAGRAREHAGDALRAAHRLACSAHAGELEPAAWRTEIAALFASVDVTELVRALDVSHLVAGAPTVARGASVVRIPPRRDFPRSEGVAAKLFCFAAGRANPPHAHDNMLSMHLVLAGRFHVRHFERIRDEKKAIWISPTVDGVLGPGEQTSISDAADNVHWHHAESDGVLLDIVAADLDRQRPTTTHLLDPDRAEPRAGLLMRAPRLTSVEEALELYG